jgi:hypothetical protein
LCFLFSILFSIAFFSSGFLFSFFLLRDVNTYFLSYFLFWREYRDQSKDNLNVRETEK